MDESTSVIPHMLPADTVAGNGPPPILVVEDDDGVRALICDLLEAEGLGVEMAANGTVALRRAAAHWPAMLVLDMGLPVLDGAGLVGALRARYGRVPPVLLITADGEGARKARQVGAFRYLKKPFDLDELIAAVTQGLSVI